MTTLICIGLITTFQLRGPYAYADLNWQRSRPVSPTPQPEASIVVSATDASKWREGQYDVWHLRGPCTIRQGDTVARSQEAILWVNAGDPYIGEPDRVIAYLEGHVRVDFVRDGDRRSETGRAAQSIEDEAWLGRFTTNIGLQFDVIPSKGEPQEKPAIYGRCSLHHRSGRDPEAIPTQFTVPVTQQGVPNQPLQLGPPPNSVQGSNGVQGLQGQGEVLPLGSPNNQPFLQGNPQFIAPPPVTNVSITPRGSSVEFVSYSFDDVERNERITIADRGVKITIRSSQLGELTGDSPIVSAEAATDTVVILADRVVAWTNILREIEGGDPNNAAQPQRWELYLEGNIVFAFAERVIYADRMYYDVNSRRGTILNAEMLTPVPEYEGLLRLRAQVLQQLDENTFQASQAAFTSSRLGYPRYWLQSGEVTIQHNQIPAIDPFTGEVAVEQGTGRPIYDHQYLTQSNNNFVYINGLPVFYWPSFSTDLSNPSYYLKSLSVKNDNVYGTQILSSWDMYQLLGISQPPDNTDWSLDVDYMSERGFGLGTVFDYQGQDLFGVPGPYRGVFDAWGIDDNGLDNLGADRRALVPEEDLRGRVLFQHRQRMGIGYQLTAEFGLISDRNFLEQYYEHEWDQFKDQTTGIEFKRLFGTQSLGISANVRLNDFFAQTQWLPRLDHFVIGQPLLLDQVSWTAHTHAGYGRLNTADAPLDPNDGKFRTLPWEADVSGIRAGTRHELNYPFAAGGVQLVPYLLGDITYWEEDLAASSATRLYGQAGLRANLPIWKTDPTVHSELMNINGLAHKVNFTIDTFWADASEDVDRFPLYDPLDDDAQEQFRRRFAFDTFGGATVPLPFDERNYAFRRGMQSYVTSPSAEIADDLVLSRLGVRQRWQTKRGYPGQQRVVDWITLDLHGTFFPDADRDNFGVDVGLVEYDFQWNVGDRFAVISDGFFDFFGDGLRTAAIGATTNRPELGSLYLGYRSIEGPITSNIISGSVSYRMSEKWIASAGTSIDLGPTGNIGQTLSFTRIGESFLVRIGIKADASRGNVGAVVGIEPRFFPRDRQNGIEGVYVPPSGARGVE